MSRDQKQEPRSMSMFTPNRKENSTHIGGATDLTPDKGLLQILNQIDLLTVWAIQPSTGHKYYCPMESDVSS